MDSDKFLKFLIGPMQPAGSPAMDHDRSVSSPPLYHQHMLNDCHDSRGGGAQTLRCPAGQLELSYLVILTRLQSKVWRNNGWVIKQKVIYQLQNLFRWILVSCNYLGVGDADDTFYKTILLCGLEDRHT